MPRALGEVLGPTHRYTTALGKTAGALVGAGTTAVMATVGNLGAPASHWTAGGTPLTAMMCIERCADAAPRAPAWDAPLAAHVNGAACGKTRDGILPSLTSRH